MSCHEVEHTKPATACIMACIVLTLYCLLLTNTCTLYEPSETGQTLRCDVFVASIHHIEITTRTRELLLGEEPERFNVQGFDEEGRDPNLCL